MIKLLKLAATLLIISTMMTGCNTAPIYNVENSKIDTPTSKQHVYHAIKKAGQSLGWKIHKIRSGKAQGKLYLRKHVAVVNIYYTGSKFSIHYVKSRNLKYDASTHMIHKNYNGWIQNLEREINTRL